MQQLEANDPVRKAFGYGLRHGYFLWGGMAISQGKDPSTLRLGLSIMPEGL